uniref:dual specificity protein kinase splA-like n=1 Tax=Oncorhynchus gorbuscha TaxID=8017 RepID=UPI001EAEB20A|nr:dual specificity protein kinase splA-like [Oncorhynchus gorbuscha]
MTATAEPEVAASEVPGPVSASLPAVALESREEVSVPTPQDTTSPSPPQSPLRLAPAPPQDSLVTVAQEERSERPETVPAAPPQPAPDQTLHQDIPAAVARATPSPLDSSEKAQLNMDEEEDEEREGSQRVSVSEMSGSQPTEESRPGSAGPAGSGWRAGGALLSELDSEVSCSQQGASEPSAPGVLEGTESMDDLGDASLKGAIDMEGMSASAGSPDFEKVPDIPTNDFDDYDEVGDRVCDMEVGSERADDPRRARRDEDEDDDVEMASEGVTESGLESYGNADEDDFEEDERLDNLNHALPALAAQWDQPNPNSFCDPWAQPHPQAASASPLQTPTSPSDPWQADMETPTQYATQPWLQLAATPFVPALHEPSHQPAPASPLEKETLAPLHSLSPIAASGRGMSHSSTLSATELAVHSNSETSTSTPEEVCDYNSSSGVESRSEGGKLHTLPAALAPVRSLQPELEDQDLGIDLESEDGEVAETLPANEVPGDPATAPTSNPSSSSTTEDEASDTEGEAQLDELGQGIHNATFDHKPGAQRCLSALEEGEETSGGAEEGGNTPQSASSAASYAYDMTASNSSNHSTAESCAKSPGIFSLEELPEEAKDQSLIQELTLPPPQQQAASADSLLVSNPEEQQYMLCGTLETELGDTGDLKPLDPALFVAPQQPGEGPRVTQPPYYSTVCENTENSLTGLSVFPQAHCRRDHHCDLLTPPRLTCADLPPRSPRLQASPQLRRLERHQQQLLELQQRREQQGKPKEEEAMKKEEEEEAAQEEEEEEVEQRQQIMRWQQELEEQAQQTSPQQQPQKGQATVLLSPSSGLHTIYEALESDEEGKQIEVNVQLEQCEEEAPLETEVDSNSDRREVLDEDGADSNSTSTLSPSPDSPEQEESRDASPECPPPLDLDWGKKVDIVQQLINQTLLLTGDGCSSLLLLPGGTLSPLEASLWPKLLPPLTPPSATVTSVSSFSPEAPGQSPQGEWTVVELETHH